MYTVSQATRGQLRVVSDPQSVSFLMKLVVAVIRLKVMVRMNRNRKGITRIAQDSYYR